MFMYNNQGYYYSTPVFKVRTLRGFTMVELIITVAIAAIVLTLAIPSFSSIIKNNRQTTMLNEFTSYFLYAKSEAVTRGTAVTFCPRNTAGTNCDASANWDDGWVVFIDVNGNGSKDAGDTIKKVHEAINNDFDISSSPSLTEITITPRGFVLSESTFTFCDSRGASFARAKILRKTGRMKSSSDSLTCS
jgi:type IV fimbrial biogenesis protein FimT